MATHHYKNRASKKKDSNQKERIVEENYGIEEIIKPGKDEP